MKMGDTMLTPLGTFAGGNALNAMRQVVTKVDRALVPGGVFDDRASVLRKNDECVARVHAAVEQMSPAERIARADEIALALETLERIRTAAWSSRGAS